MSTKNYISHIARYLIETHRHDTEISTREVSELKPPCIIYKRKKWDNYLIFCSHITVMELASISCFRTQKSIVSFKHPPCMQIEYEIFLT